MENEIAEAEQGRNQVRNVRRFLHVLKAGWETLERWREGLARRRALRELDDRPLKAIGVSRADIEREANKPFWRD